MDVANGSPGTWEVGRLSSVDGASTVEYFESALDVETAGNAYVYGVGYIAVVVGIVDPDAVV